MGGRGEGISGEKGFPPTELPKKTTTVCGKKTLTHPHPTFGFFYLLRRAKAKGKRGGLEFSPAGFLCGFATPGKRGGENSRVRAKAKAKVKNY